MEEQEHLRGDVWLANLGERVGSEQAGLRPVIIIQNNVGNKFSPTVIVASISSRKKKQLPTHVYLTKEEADLAFDSVVMLEQIRTIDKKNLINRKTLLSSRKMKEVNAALLVSVMNQ